MSDTTTFTKGDRIQILFFDEERHGVVVRQSSEAIIWVRFDGETRERFVHIGSLQHEVTPAMGELTPEQVAAGFDLCPDHGAHDHDYCPGCKVGVVAESEPQKLVPGANNLLVDVSVCAKCKAENQVYDDMCDEECPDDCPGHYNYDPANDMGDGTYQCDHCLGECECDPGECEQRDGVTA